ncbi:helix-turn-helix domain-containing protein [Clostridium septicum]|uniref:helix-turn-helix domain-containing protein n=1 Tax=Clostridium septicum TaxID=1504 RepID=UPI0008360010|nr:helix-turn-helix transcriptional regulator [Clostridium septicum]
MNDRVKEIRKALGLTQQEFGQTINVSRSNVGNIEKGVINLTDRNIALICNTHKINEEWLRTGNGDMFAKMDSEEEFAYLIGALLAEDDCTYKKDFIKAMLSLEDKRDWDLVLNLVKRLKER